jgi:hypothetical protein
VTSPGLDSRGTSPLVVPDASVRLATVMFTSPGRGTHRSGHSRPAGCLLAGVWIPQGHGRARDVTYRLGEAGACRVVAGPGPADRFQDLGGGEVAEVTLRLLQAQALGMLVA